MAIIWRQAVCRWCGRELEHKRISKPRRFCCTTHRVAFWRADQTWRQAQGRANIAEAEPRPFGYPIQIVKYQVFGDQLAQRADRPGKETGS